MYMLLGQQGAYVDDLYFCPHHPDRGFEGEVRELKIKCDCRKPAVGMLLRAAREHQIDLQESWMIGDMTVDVQTGKNAGMKTVLLKTGAAGSDQKYDVQPDVTAANLLEAVQIILQKRKEM